MKIQIDLDDKQFEAFFKMKARAEYTSKKQLSWTAFFLWLKQEFERK